MAITQFATLSDDASTYIRDSLLDIAEKNMVFAQHALMADLPQHNSKTCQFSRYPRLDLPLSPVATEGTTPSDQQALAVETVQAVVDQWILIVGLTDIAQLTVKHPLMPIVSDLLGLAQAELVDREIQKALMADAGVTFAGTTSRAGLTGTHYVTPTVLGDVWASLRRNGARPLGMNYVLIVDPEVSQDILAGTANTTFVSVHSFQQVKAIYNNQIGSFMGFDVEVSNFIPVVTFGASADFTVAAQATGSLTSDGGNLSETATIFVVIEGVNPSTGLVEKVYAPKSTDLPSITTESVDITTPSSTSYVYNIYVSNVENSSAVTALHLITSYVAAATLVNVTSISNSADNPQAQVGSGADDSVHTSYAIGREAYGMVKLSGDNLRVLMTDGKPSDSDPAAQRRKISLKGSFKALVLNSDWVIRVESNSAF